MRMSLANGTRRDQQSEPRQKLSEFDESPNLGLENRAPVRSCGNAQEIMKSKMAERVGFEPTCRLPDKSLSRRSRYDHFGTSPVVRRQRMRRASRPAATAASRRAVCRPPSTYWGGSKDPRPGTARATGVTR